MALRWRNPAKAHQPARRRIRGVVRLIDNVREIAYQHGYALGVHGSLSRDIDLIAVPWTPKAKAPRTLTYAIKRALNGVWIKSDQRDLDRNPAKRAHGRRTWSIYGVLGTYIDLSVMPRRKDSHD